jgi:Ca2+-binding RTX toxin-like protein
VIDGGPTGNDTLTGGGGTGVDTISFASSWSAVRVNLATNSATGSGTDVITGFENITGSDHNDSLTGDALANVIIGGLGDDAMFGAAGNDMYVIWDAAEMGVNELITDTGGTDEIRYTQVTVTAGLPLAASTLTLSDRISGVERVVIEAGLGAVTYTVAGVVTGSAGIAAVNVDASAVTAAPIIIVGNAGNNILGGTSATLGDTLVGGLGNDTYVVDRATDVILEGNLLATEIDTANVDFKASGTYVLGANVENGTVVSADTTLLVNITGNALVNTLTGNSGDNILDGLGGADTMLGGLGDDSYVVDSLLDVVLENPGEGNDTIRAAITYTLAGLLDVENLTLIGAAAINGTGNDLDNEITGNGAINTLTGGLGNDTLIGGAGNDTYVVDSLLDVVVENANEGTDTVQSAFTYVLTTLNVENLTLTGTAAINGTGSIGNNLITGNSGNNILDGGTGTDTLVGGAGNDDYIIDDLFDVVTEAAGAGTDTVHTYASYTLSANVENLTLKGTNGINGIGNTLNNIITGNIAANSILGDAGNDTMTGGLGADSMQGGLGSDHFIYTSAADSTIAARDLIYDFTRGTQTVGDKINLSAIDANTNLTGNDAFLTTLLASSGNFTQNAQLRYWNDGVNTYLEGNTDGVNSTAEFSVQLVGVFTALTGSTALSGADIIV